MEKKAAALLPTAGKSHGTDDDLISRLSDDTLGTIISLLPTKDGGRTQALSRRWRHLWRSAPLNLEVYTFHPMIPYSAVPPSAVSKIISQHPGPARRFSFTSLCAGDLYDKAELCLCSRARTNLQELDIGYNFQVVSASTAKSYPLPLSALRSASTLRVLKIIHCDFPSEIAPTMSFPLLKRLSLHDVSIPGNVFQGLLSRCHALESLYMTGVCSSDGLRVIAPALRSIGIQVRSVTMTELVIEDAPCLERLLLPYCHDDNCVTIRVISAPKLEILGMFPADSSKLQVFKGLSPASSANSIRTLKVLALRCSNNRLNAILGVLRWLPCLEKLYVSFLDHHNMHKKNNQQHDPLQPIECLQTHLKKVVLKLYSAYEQQVDFARFFVLNAQVLNKIEFEVRADYSSEEVARQHKLLQVENRASRDAQFDFRSTCFYIDYNLSKHIHDLSSGDPFRQPRKG